MVRDDYPTLTGVFHRSDDLAAIADYPLVLEEALHLLNSVGGYLEDVEVVEAQARKLAHLFRTTRHEKPERKMALVSSSK